MSNPVRRLVRNDQVRHGAPMSSMNPEPAIVAEDVSAAPSAFEYLSATNGESQADTPVVMHQSDTPFPGRATTEAPEGQEAPPLSQDLGPPSSAQGEQEELEYLDAGVAPPRVAAAAVRPSIVDVLTSLCPVFRAAHVFPGVQVPASQMANAVAQMSEQVVKLSHALARDADPLEIDQAWMRARMGTFVAELVAATWLTGYLARGGSRGAIDPEGEMQRLAACVDAAIQVTADDAITAGTGSRVAAVVSVMPLVYHLEQYGHFVRKLFPTFPFDLDGAADRIGAALADEVRDAVARLTPLVPDEARYELASELMAHGGKFAFDARETACGEVVEKLRALAEGENAEEKMLAFLQSNELQGGVPVDRTIALLHTMFSRAVGTIEHSARVMLGRGT